MDDGLADIASLIIQIFRELALAFTEGMELWPISEGTNRLDMYILNFLLHTF